MNSSLTSQMQQQPPTPDVLAVRFNDILINFTNQPDNTLFDEFRKVVYSKQKIELGDLLIYINKHCDILLDTEEKLNNLVKFSGKHSSIIESHPNIVQCVITNYLATDAAKTLMSHVPAIKNAIQQQAVAPQSMGIAPLLGTSVGQKVQPVVTAPCAVIDSSVGPVMSTVQQPEPVNVATTPMANMSITGEPAVIPVSRLNNVISLADARKNSAISAKFYNTAGNFVVLTSVDVAALSTQEAMVYTSELAHVNSLINKLQSTNYELRDDIFKIDIYAPNPDNVKTLASIVVILQPSNTYKVNYVTVHHTQATWSDVQEEPATKVFRDLIKINDIVNAELNSVLWYCNQGVNPHILLHAYNCEKGTMENAWQNTFCIFGKLEFNTQRRLNVFYENNAARKIRSITLQVVDPLAIVHNNYFCPEAVLSMKKNKEIVNISNSITVLNSGTITLYVGDLVQAQIISENTL